MTYFCLLVENCLAIPQGKIYSVDEGHYGYPGSLLMLFVPFIVIIAVIVALKYLARYKDSAAEGVAEAIGATFGILSNGIVTLLKVFLFGIGLFSLIMFFVFLSKFEPFCNFGIVYEKIMMILFAIVAFCGPSVYKYMTRKSISPKQNNKQIVSSQGRVIDTEEGVVDLGLSVLWTNTDFPLKLKFRDLKKPEIFTNSFRFPTKEELDELIIKCRWQKTYINEENYGYKVIGPSGESIFLQSSYKKEDTYKEEFTMYPLFISIYFVDKENYYVWQSSEWKRIPLPYIQTSPVVFTKDSYIGKIVVKNRN